jgi:hypothetical protein
LGFLRENPAPEGRTRLAQRFSAGTGGRNDASPVGTTELSRTLLRDSVGTAAHHIHPVLLSGAGTSRSEAPAESKDLLALQGHIWEFYPRVMWRGRPRPRTLRRVPSDGPGFLCKTGTQVLLGEVLRDIPSDQSRENPTPLRLRLAVAPHNVRLRFALV